MSHEATPQVSPAELHDAIDSAAVQAHEVGRHQRTDYLHGHDESLRSLDTNHNIFDTQITRSSDEWFHDRTDVDMNVLRPSEPGEDPYHRAGANYKAKMSGNLGARTRIERRNQKGEVVYTHESKDLQFARRVGKVAAKVIERQSVERANHLSQAA